jgi:hypothetical protein
MPLQYQPAVTRAFVEVSSGYLRYGAYPSDNSAVVQVAFSSITVLLACIPLFDALRSTAPPGPRPRDPQHPQRARTVAAILLAPLALFALIHLAQAVGYGMGVLSVFFAPQFLRHAVYFWPPALIAPMAGPSAYANLPAGWAPTLGDSIMEFSKWGIVLAIAVWLSVAQLTAWRHARKAKQHQRSRLETGMVTDHPI